jgi:hypothetical protein
MRARKLQFLKSEMPAYESRDINASLRAKDDGRKTRFINCIEASAELQACLTLGDNDSGECGVRAWEDLHYKCLQASIDIWPAKVADVKATPASERLDEDYDQAMLECVDYVHDDDDDTGRLDGAWARGET